MKILEFFSDDNGQLSAMRLYSFIALWVAIYVTIKAIGAEHPNMELVLIWVAGAFAPKVVQKVVEKFADKKTK